MEKYKTIVQIEKIKKCLEQGKCREALEIAEKVDKKRIKNVSDLGIVAESYFQNQRYQIAKELFLRIYEKSRSRRVVAQLVHLSIRLEEIKEAEDYLEEFIDIAPLDFYQYIFRYSIDKLKKMPLVKLIEDLENLKKAEYIESWAYELAKLYHKAGLKDKCITECNDIILWFGEGDYVERARALRAYYLGELDPTVFAQKKEATKPQPQAEEEETQEDDNVESEAFKNSPMDQEEEDKVDEGNTVHSVDSDGSENTIEMEDMAEETFLNQTSNDSMMTSVEADEDDDISLAVAQVVDAIFEDSGIENNLEAETQNKEEIEYKIEEAQSQEDIQAVNKQKDEDIQLTSMSIRNDEVVEILEDDNQGNEEEEVAAVITQSKDKLEALDFQKDEETKVRIQGELTNSESEVGKLQEKEANQEEEAFLHEEANQEKQEELQINDQVKQEAKSQSENQEGSVKDLQENVREEGASSNMDQWNESMEEKLQKKIQLKIMTNEQLVGEEADELLPYLEQRQINLADIFGYFVRVESVQKQLVRSIDQALAQKNNINIILTGEEKSGKTRLSKCIAKLLYRMNLVSSTRIALIEGDKINSIPLLSKKEQLSECVMVIEHAGRMTKETIRTLIELKEELHGHVAIILEDTRENMNRLLRENSIMNGVFNNRIHLPKYTLEDYMGFAYDYITEKEFEIEREAFIALQNDFSSLMKKKRENTLTAIFSYLDHIMHKAEKRSTANLKTMTETGQFGIAELMVIKKEDL